MDTMLLLALLLTAGSGAGYAGRPSSPLACAPEGVKCNFDSDCCTKNCVSDPRLGRICKPQGASWTCKPNGTKCNFGSDCCSKNCVSDPHLGRVCKPKGASWTCKPSGRQCNFHSDCCSKRCESYKGRKVCQ